MTLQWHMNVHTNGARAMEVESGRGDGFFDHGFPVIGYV